MTPAIKELQLKVHEWECSLHPTVPAAYIPLNTYTDKTANGLTRCIVDFEGYDNTPEIEIYNDYRE